MKVSINISGLTGKTFATVLSVALGICVFYGRDVYSHSEIRENNCSYHSECPHGTCINARRKSNSLPSESTKNKVKHEYDIYAFIALKALKNLENAVKEISPDLISVLLGKSTVPEESSGDEI